MITFRDIQQDLLELSQHDGVDRSMDIELLEQLTTHPDITQVQTDIDFWNDETTGDSFNSYNNGAPVVFEIKQFTPHITGIAFHRAGDVRGNYTDGVFIACTMEELLQTIAELVITRTHGAWTMHQSYLTEFGYITAYNHETDEDYYGFLETDSNAPAGLLDAYKQTDLYNG